MRIISNQQSYGPKTAFKAAPQKEVLQRTLKIMKNKESQKVFIKLSTLAGLTGLISIVTSFFNKGIKSNDSYIETLKTKYTDINNSYLTNPETVGTFLDITSSSDSKDAEIKTKKHTAQKTLENKRIISDINIRPEELEKYIEEAKKQKLNSILNQAEIISSSPNAEIVSKSIDEKIDTLAIEAEKLRNDEETSSLYGAFAEIAKKLSISSFVEIYNTPEEQVEENEILPNEKSESSNQESVNKEAEKNVNIEEVQHPENPQVAEPVTVVEKQFTPIVLPENEKVKLKVSIGAKPRAESEFFVSIKSYDKPDTLEIYNTLASIYNAICGENRKEKSLNNNEEVKNSKLVEIISKRVDAIKTLKINNQKIEIEKLLEEFNTQSVQEDYVVPEEKETIYTPELFKTEILEPRVNMIGYELLAKTFDKYSALICSIYNAIQKENLREIFLFKLSEKDRSEELNQYIKFGGQQSKLDFMSYLAISDFKRSQGLDLTLNDFRELESFKDVTLKYSTYDSKEGKTLLYFREDADFAKRFETAISYFKALYSIKQGDIVKPSLDKVTEATVINELKKKILKDPSEYENILNFIGLKLKPNFAGQKLTEEGIQSLINAQLEDEKLLEKFYLILVSLQSPSFDDFIQGTHGRMRFIERIVLDKNKNISIDNFEKEVNTIIEDVKQEVETRYPIILMKYEALENDEHENRKYSPQLRLGNYGKYIIGLNSKGQIHTIYPPRSYKKY